MFAIAFRMPQPPAALILSNTPRKNALLFRRFDMSLCAGRLGIAFGGKAR